MNVERRLGRSSLLGRVVPRVAQNPPNGGWLSNESDDLHLGAASAGQRIDVVDFEDELRHRLRTARFAEAGSPPPSSLFCWES